MALKGRHRRKTKNEGKNKHQKLRKKETTTRRHKPSFRPGLSYTFASGLFGFRHAGHAILAKTDQ